MHPGCSRGRCPVEAPEGVAIADVHPAVEILTSQPHADLMTTARLFLDHGGDVAAAAMALHLHRTTVYYRLSRIQKLAGVDLRDGLARIDFQLALWLEAYPRVKA